MDELDDFFTKGSIKKNLSFMEGDEVGEKKFKIKSIAYSEEFKGLAQAIIDVKEEGLYYPSYYKKGDFIVYNENIVKFSGDNEIRISNYHLHSMNQQEGYNEVLVNRILNKKKGTI